MPSSIKIPPLAQLVIAMGLMWLIENALLPGSYMGGWQTPGAMLFTAVGIGFVLAGGVTFHQAKTTVNPLSPENATTLVTGGVYTISRNPMYLGCLLTLIGWGTYLGSLLAFSVVPLFLFTITRFQILAEERALEARFGDAYREYKQRVRRWI